MILVALLQKSLSKAAGQSLRGVFDIDLVGEARPGDFGDDSGLSRSELILERSNAIFENFLLIAFFKRSVFGLRGDSVAIFSFSLGVTAGDDEGVAVVETLGDPERFDLTPSLGRIFVRRGLSNIFSDFSLVFSGPGPLSEFVSAANRSCFLGVVTGVVCSITFV